MEEGDLSMQRKITEETAAICGLFCGICPSYPERCHGCLSDYLRPGCDVCHGGFRVCTKAHGVKRCCDCKGYPCERLEAFRTDGKPHHLVVTDAVGKMKELGIEEWLRAQIEQHTCPDCGELIWWERDTCQACGHRLER